MKGRRGYIPTCYTEFARYCVERGYTSEYVKKMTGMRETTIRRHWLGWPLSRLASIAYRACFPDAPGIPLRGRPIRYAYPLPIRALPLRIPRVPPGWEAITAPD